MDKIEDYTKTSLKRRLKKSLSHDWIPESRAHTFPLRNFYVQVNWSKKVRKAMREEKVTLTSLHELIKEKTKSDADYVQQRELGQSIVIEGNIISEFFIFWCFPKNVLRIGRMAITSEMIPLVF